MLSGMNLTEADSAGKPRLRPVLSGTCSFFFFFSVLVFLLFLSGNRQGFLARSQLLLLRILESSSLLCLISGAYYFIYTLISKAFKSRPRPRYLVISLGTALSGGVLFILARFILALSLPVR